MNNIGDIGRESKTEDLSVDARAAAPEYPCESEPEPRADGHVYDRPLEIDMENENDDSLVFIARHINPGSRVLELGVATGYFSRFLSGKLGCTVDGVELDPQMAGQARPFLSRLVVGDLETMELSGEFPQATYDWVVLADILEHLRDPSLVLKQLPGLLAEGGKVIISIPNTAYAGLILELLGGGLTYRSEGLLDRTHLRFYTRSSFTALLQEIGYTVESAELVRLPLERSEFFPSLSHYAVPLAHYLASRTEAIAYQYVFTAVPRA